ncbi:MAG TPA: kelch repeat-containing protein [Nannocystaceae bacterium]|nr:kelch repeat-containing protein [Nannocystaceae bacterium]
MHIHRLIVGVALVPTIVGCFSPEDPTVEPTETGSGESSSTSGTLTTTTTTMDTTADSSTAGPTTSPDSSSTAVDSTESSSSGTGTTTTAGAPEIEVTIDDAAVANGDAFAFTTLDVGMQQQAVVRIENVGTADLAISGVTVSGPDDAHFVIDDAALPAMLAPTETGGFTVSFSPTNGGAKGITVEIGSDDEDEDPFALSFAGHTTPNTYRMLAPAASPSARFNHSLDDLGDGRLLLFGGRDAAGVWLNDTWIFDVEAETWTQLAPATPPSIRNSHETAYDGAGTVVLFGGSQTMGGGTLGDTWVFDVATEEWSSVGGVGPAARHQHGMLPMGDGNVLLYGGRTAGGGSEVADTWIFDVAAQTWSQPMPTGAPPATSAFAFAFDGADIITLYGGFASSAPLDTTWSYTISTNTWAAAAPMMTPGPRAVLQGEYLGDGRMFVFSGKLNGCCIDPTGGTFAFDPVAGNWADITPPGEPSPRFNYAMTGVGNGDKTIIFGGLLVNTGFGTALAETWEYVGTDVP